jgi:hypothetical protein
LAVGSFVTLGVAVSLIWNARPGGPREKLIPILSRRDLETAEGAWRARRMMVLVGATASTIALALLVLALLHP